MYVVSHMYLYDCYRFVAIRTSCRMRTFTCKLDNLPTPGVLVEISMSCFYLLGHSADFDLRYEVCNTTIADVTDEICLFIVGLVRCYRQLEFLRKSADNQQKVSEGSCIGELIVLKVITRSGK